ncbi:unnamed protein product [Symbiodinium sp. CCMP2456]|nr:unnamed protein product [Symbiodinium sp. CCMP2456]
MVQMPTAKVALEMCYALHAFSKLAKLLPSVEAVPALYGKADRVALLPDVET